VAADTDDIFPIQVCSLDKNRGAYRRYISLLQRKMTVVYCIVNQRWNKLKKFLIKKNENYLGKIVSQLGIRISFNVLLLYHNYHKLVPNLLELCKTGYNFIKNMVN
jgi:hypothetical protein